MKDVIYENVELIKYGEHCGLSEIQARSEAGKNDLPFVSPYNDMDVIHGQGTVALEILKQNSHIDYIFVPVGGGGLVSGIALYAKLARPDVKIIGCQPVNDCCLYECVKANKVVLVVFMLIITGLHFNLCTRNLKE